MFDPYRTSQAPDQNQPRTITVETNRLEATFFYLTEEEDYDYDEEKYVVKREVNQSVRVFEPVISARLRQGFLHHTDIVKTDGIEIYMLHFSGVREFECEIGPRSKQSRPIFVKIAEDLYVPPSRILKVETKTIPFKQEVVVKD